MRNYFLTYEVKGVLKQCRLLNMKSIGVALNRLQEVEGKDVRVISIVDISIDICK